MTGYNFTESVRRVLAASREEAAVLRHEYVGTEHILLALLRVEGTVAHVAMVDLGADIAAMRDLVIQTVKPGQPGTTRHDLPYTSRAKKVLELAMEAALELHDNYVGTEHLLLGLIAEKKGIAAQVLMEQGVTLQAAREAVAQAVKRGGNGVSAPPQSEASVRRHEGTAAVNERLRAVMNAAFQIANASGCRTVGAPHCAIALLDNGEGVANAAFARLGLDPARVRTAVAAIPRGESEPVTPEEVLQLDQRLITAMERERVAGRAPALSTAHLALALLADDSEVAPCFVAGGVTRASFSEELGRISG